MELDSTIGDDLEVRKMISLVEKKAAMLDFDALVIQFGEEDQGEEERWDL